MQNSPRSLFHWELLLKRLFDSAADLLLHAVVFESSKYTKYSFGFKPWPESKSRAVHLKSHSCEQLLKEEKQKILF